MFSKPTFFRGLPLDCQEWVIQPKKELMARVPLHAEFLTEKSKIQQCYCDEYRVEPKDEDIQLKEQQLDQLIKDRDVLSLEIQRKEQCIEQKKKEIEEIEQVIVKAKNNQALITKYLYACTAELNERYNQKITYTEAFEKWFEKSDEWTELDIELKKIEDAKKKHQK